MAKGKGRNSWIVLVIGIGLVAVGGILTAMGWSAEVGVPLGTLGTGITTYGLDKVTGG